MTKTRKDINGIVSDDKQIFKFKQEKIISPKFLPTKPIVAVSPIKRATSKDNYKQTKVNNPAYGFPNLPDNCFRQMSKELIETKTEQKVFLKPSGQTAILNRKVAQIRPYNVLNDRMLDITVNKNKILHRSVNKTDFKPLLHDKKQLIKSTLLI